VNARRISRSFREGVILLSIHRCFILAKQLRQRGSQIDRGGDEDGVELGRKERDSNQEQADTVPVSTEGSHDVLLLPGLSDHTGMPRIRNVVRHDGEAHGVGGTGDSNYFAYNSGKLAIIFVM